MASSTAFRRFSHRMSTDFSHTIGIFYKILKRYIYLLSGIPSRKSSGLNSRVSNGTILQGHLLIHFTGAFTYKDRVTHKEYGIRDDLKVLNSSKEAEHSIPVIPERTACT